MRKLFYMIICFVIGVFIGQLIDDLPTMPQEPQDVAQTDFYDNIVKDINTIEIYETKELTTDIMSNRNGKIIVEKVVGEVINYKLDGKNFKL